MRRILISILFTCFFLSFSCADFTDFYSNIKIPPEKLIPNTLNAVLSVGEEKSFKVDVIPKFADGSKLIWECVPDIADITYNGKSCLLKARDTGEAILYAKHESGALCQIKINILPQKTEISIEGADESIKIGEQVVLLAHTEPEGEVKWQVNAGDIASVSYGGNKCKIRAKSAGRVTVSASAKNGEKAVETLIIEPSEGMNLSLFGFILTAIAVALLTAALIFYLKLRRENEK